MSPSSEEFTIGNRFSALTAACTKNGVTVSLTPARSNSAFSFSRVCRILRAIDFEECRDVSRSAPAHDHVFGNRLPHRRQRHAFDVAGERSSGGRRCRRDAVRAAGLAAGAGALLACGAALFDVAQNVAFGDAAVDAGAFAGQRRQDRCRVPSRSGEPAARSGCRSRSTSASLFGFRLIRLRRAGTGPATGAGPSLMPGFDSVGTS